MVILIGALAVVIFFFAWRQYFRNNKRAQKMSTDYKERLSKKLAETEAEDLQEDSTKDN